MNKNALNKPIFYKVKMPYKRKKETKKRVPYKLEEARLRPLIIKELRQQGFIVMRVETLVAGFGDLWLMHRTGSWSGWAELKTPTGKQSYEQQKFQEMCLLNNIKYVVLRSIEDAKNIFAISKLET